MILIDTDVAVDILRGFAPAGVWMNSLGNMPIGIPGLVAMERIQGCSNKTDLQRVSQFCKRFTLHWPTEWDCERALKDYESFHLSHRLGLLDSLIAHTAVGLKETLATST